MSIIESAMDTGWSDGQGNDATLYAVITIHPHRTRRRKRLVLETRVDIELRSPIKTKLIVRLEREVIQRIMRLIEMAERQERIDEGELNETDLQIPG